MKFHKFILTMATLLITGSAVAAGFDSRNTPVFTPGSAANVQIKADLPQGASAVQFTLALPESFELGSESLTLNSQLSSRMYNEGNGKYNYVLYTDDNSPINTGTDWLFGLNLKAGSTIKKGTYTLRFSNIIAATAEGVETRISDCNVALTVKIPVSQVIVTPPSGSIPIGGTLQLTASILPSEAEQGVSWKSDNPAIASVDTNGKVLGLKVGKTRITACSTDNTEIFGYCDVTVDPILATSITLDRTSLELRAGDVGTLNVTVSPENTTNNKVTWTSSDRSIATVDDKGTVTTLKAGSVTVTATTTDGTNLIASCKVTVLPPLATAVILSKSEVSMIVMESVSLTATVNPADAEQKVTWSSSDTKIVSVDSTGTLTALAAGTVVVTAAATDGSGVSASCTVTVKDAKVSSITLSKTALGMRIGQSETITAIVMPEYAADRRVTWSTDKPAVASVDANGKITALSLGEATITATATDGSGVTASCAVTVTNALASGISLDRSDATLFVNQVLRLTATVTPEGAVRSVNWSSDMFGVATVDKDGNVRAISPGSAIITATTADGTNLTATCIITVEPIKAESVTLSASSWSGKVGEGFSLIATVLPEDATDKTVTWNSSDASVATVDSNGNMKAAGLGNAVITASCGNVSATCNVTVVPTLVEILTVSPDSWDGIEGESFRITATVLPEDATDKSLNWSSSDPEVATVDSEGNVSVLKDGNCVIRVATLDGSELSAVCVVTSLSGIDEIFSDSDIKVDIYTLSGTLLYKHRSLKEVNHLKTGLYIIRNERETKTAFIKR